MAKSQPKITLSESRSIPFDKLVLSQSNVRRIKAGVSIEELAEDIARRTLLQSLTVRPVLDESGADTGMYEVPAGGRRYRASAVPSTGHRNGRRERQVMGSFGAVTVAVPRARLDTADGRTTEWVNKTLPAYRRRTREVDALIAGAYLAGTNTRRVGRALTAIFRGAISKSTVSRVWRQIKADWESWNKRDLSQEDIVRLILDGHRRQGAGSTGRPRRSRCLSCWACGATGRRCCWP
jgi:hypothetical protein